MCNEVIKLVDFDAAVRQSQAGQLEKRYGTVGCAAPEQYSQELLDERTDIYAIGTVLYYMLTGFLPGTSPAYPRDLICPGLTRIIKRCLQTKPERRYQSVTELCEQLEQIQREEEGVFTNDQVTSLTIAVVGTGPGIGSTHIAMGLASYLTRQGIPVLLEERHDAGGIWQLAKYCHAVMDAYGIYRIGGQPMLPFYGPAVRMPPHSWQIVVRDYGSGWDQPEVALADLVLLVSTGKPWHTEREKSAYQSLGSLPGLAVIYNHFCRRLSVRPQGLANGTCVFFMPNFTNPLTGTRQSDQCFEQIWADRVAVRQGGSLRKRFRNTYRSLKTAAGRIADMIRSG